jgi:NTE family protein
MFSDKTEHNIKMSKVFTRYLNYMDELYIVIEQFTDTTKLDKKQLKRIRSKYEKIKKEHTEIKDIFYISRDETNPSIFENADFSSETIKNSIEECERKTNRVLNDGNSSNDGGLTYTQRCILDVAGFSMFFNLGKSDLLQNSIFGYC